MDVSSGGISALMPKTVNAPPIIVAQVPVIPKKLTIAADTFDARRAPKIEAKNPSGSSTISMMSPALVIVLVH